MAYRVVEESSLTRVADAIRAQTGKAEQIPFPNGFETAPAKLVEIGRQAATAVCQAKHYATTMPGSGSDKLTFHLPFEPDMVVVTGFDPTALINPPNAMLLLYDIRAYGLMGGIIAGSHSTSSSPKYTAITSESAKTRYSRDENGLVTIQNCNPVSSDTFIFETNVQYTIIAVKYTDKTDKERITEMVNGLTGSGSLTMNRNKVNAAFTTEEWDSLIATKPDWTFAFI